MTTRTLPAPTAGMLRAQRPTGLLLALAVILVAFLMQSAPGFAFMILDGALRAPESGLTQDETLFTTLARAELIVALLSFAMAGGVIWIWVRARERRPFSSLGFEPVSAGPRLALRGGAIGLVMLLACVLVPVLSGQTQLAFAAPSAAGVGFIFLMLGAFLVQGSTEEILTRGFLTQAAARRFGLVMAIAIQAVVFALMHGTNPGIGVLPVVNLLLFAVFASLLSLADGSLWGICAMHGVWNWAQGNVFGIAVSGGTTADSLLTTTPTPGAHTLITGGSFGVEGSIITTLVYLVGSAIAWRAFQKRRKITTV